MSNNKPPKKTYYDCYEFSDWFTKHKGVNIGELINAHAAGIRSHNGQLINVGGSKFSDWHIDEERYPQKFDFDAIQKAYDEVFGTSTIQVYFWW